MTELLQVENLQAGLGLYRILHGISFSAREGEVLVLIGRNGAGKTTTLRSIMGLTRILGGRILWQGRPIQGWPPYRIARLGIGYVPEDRGLFRLLTVEENLRLGLRQSRLWRAQLKRVVEIFPDLERLLSQRAGTLSGGQQQMLALARALMGENRLLLVDEPSKGLAPLLVERLAQHLKAMARDTTILLVEQNLPLALQVGDRFAIVEDGRTLHTGPMEELARDRNLQETYLGVKMGEVAR
ncbi:MAG: ABC transporter ATP-binding protein [Bacillota bacterium]|nr:ABC transporter ATP-binding protein [Bacillota bacterium]